MIWQFEIDLERLYGTLELVPVVLREYSERKSKVITPRIGIGIGSSGIKEIL